MLASDSIYTSLHPLVVTSALGQKQTSAPLSRVLQRTDVVGSMITCGPTFPG
jgi:hypothetical protein